MPSSTDKGAKKSRKTIDLECKSLIQNLKSQARNNYGEHFQAPTGQFKSFKKDLLCIICVTRKIGTADEDGVQKFVNRFDQLIKGYLEEQGSFQNFIMDNAPDHFLHRIDIRPDRFVIYQPEWKSVVS